MNNSIFTSILERELNKLKDEINAYEDESHLWHVDKGISNSAGNLCLHLMGNLNHFIGSALGNTGYIRDRDKEFSLKNIPRKDLLDGIDNTIVVIRKSIETLSDADLGKTFPIPTPMGEISIAFFLVHLCAHLDYHLGQINYHRRLLV